jgi:hypothetical protein
LAALLYTKPHIFIDTLAAIALQLVATDCVFYPLIRPEAV